MLDGRVLIESIWETPSKERASQPPVRSRALDCESLDCTFTATSGSVDGQRGLRRRDESSKEKGPIPP